MLLFADQPPELHWSWPFFVFGPILLLVIWRLVRRSRVYGKRYFPTGNPSRDAERLKHWWTLEFAYCGIPREAAIEYLPCNDSTRPAGPLQAMLAAFGLAKSPIPVAHCYSTEIHAGVYPLWASVFTGPDGTVLQILYQGIVRRSVSSTLTIRKTAIAQGIDTLGKFEGEGAEELNADRALLSALDRALCGAYETGFVSRREVSFQHPACCISPAKDGALVQLVTTLRSRGICGPLLPGFFPVELTFGLKAVVAVFSALEGTPSASEQTC